MSSVKLEVIGKAISLMEYTMRITSNRKRYPSKYITLVKRIQNKCMDIYESLMQANCLSKELLDERLLLQKKAIIFCDQLSCYIELSLNMNIVGSNTANDWQKKVNDVLYMTIAWNKTEKK